MANSLTIPPYRAALLTNADGSPVTRAGPNGGGDPIATERQWYMFWQAAAQQINDGATLLGQLAGLVDYGNQTDRPDPEFATDGALYVEWDRGSVIYQNQGGIWVYVAGIMYGTLVPDQRPADLGPSEDVGFQFRTSTDPARAFAWSGTAWIETTPIRYGTHAERLAETIANLVSGMLWMETDRGSVIYQNQGGTWLFLTGTMWGTMVPDQRPTDLGVHDAGFDYRSTDPPPREFIWAQTAWVEVTNISGATGLTHPNVVTKVGAAGQIVEGGITDESAGNSDRMHVTSVGVGIGATPSTLLHLKKNVGSGLGPVVTLENTSGALSDSGSIRFVDSSLRGELRFSVDASPFGADLIYFGGGGGATEVFRVASGGAIRFASLPSANPGLGTKQIWYDPADGNRLKYSP